MITFWATLRPAFVNEDYTVDVTIAGSGSIAGWNFTGTLDNPAGTEIPGAVVVTIIDAPNRVIRLAIHNQNLPGAGDYRLVCRRTDTPARTVVFWGTLEVADPRGFL